MTLNAYTVLMEFCDNEHCFQLLTQETVLRKLVGVCC